MKKYVVSLTNITIFVMRTVDIKLYDIFRKDLSLSDDKARELVQTLDEASNQKVEEKTNHMMEVLRKDILSLREHLDQRFEFNDKFFATKEDIAKTKVAISDSKAEITRWMFIFWAGQIAATLGFIWLFLKK
jgi:uncharacterized ubiquitin-like protein YukD